MENGTMKSRGKVALGGKGSFGYSNGKMVAH